MGSHLSFIKKPVPDLFDPNGKSFKEQVAFTEPFYSTKIKLLLRKDLAESLSKSSIDDFDAKLKKIRIGVMGGTTTLEQFQNNESRYTFKILNAENKTATEGKNALEKALDALESREIEALGSDGIILQSFLKEGVTGSKTKPQGSPTDLTARSAYQDKGFAIFPSQEYPSPENRQSLPGMRTEDYAIAIAKKRPNQVEISEQINGILRRPGSKLQKAKESLATFEARTVVRGSYIPPIASVPTNTDNAWWVPIIVAIIALVGVVITAILNPQLLSIAIAFFRPKDNKRSLYGVVLDELTNAKVESAAISLEATGLSKTESTDSEGLFSFYFQCSENEICLRVNKDGYRSYNRRISIADCNGKPIEIKLSANK